MALHADDDATLDDLREAVTSLEEIEPIARRVLGSAHPTACRLKTVYDTFASGAPRPRDAAAA